MTRHTMQARLLRILVAPLIFLLAASQAALGQVCKQPEFAPGRMYSTGSGPQSVKMGDLDGDGDLDLVVGRSAGVSVLLNNGDGTFGASITYGGAGNAGEIVVIGNLNPSVDNHLDLVLANAGSDDIEVLLGNGDGTFGPGTLHAVGAKPQAMAIGELDGQPGDDLVVGNTFGGGASVLLNNGDGTFAPQVMYPAGTFPEGVAIGDLDGDTDLDFVVVNGGSGTVSVLRNLGNGTFVSAGTYSAGDQPWSVVIADLDGDGDNDLAIANRGTDVASVLLNNGNASFAAPVSYPAGDEPIGIAVGDFNNDTKPDLVVSNRVSDNLSILLNNGDGTFAAQVTFATGDNPRAAAVGDLDGDMDMDLAVPNRVSGTVMVSFNTCLGGPANDLCVHATLITQDTFQELLDTSGASVEDLELAESCGGPAGNGHSVWYQFTPPLHGRIHISTAGSDYETVVSIYDGGCDVGSLIVCDDGPGGAQLQDVVVTAETTYLIKVSSVGDLDGGLLDFDFSYEPSAVPPLGQWTVLVHGAASPGEYPGIVGSVAARIGSLSSADVVLHTMNLDTFALIPQDLDPTKHHVVQFDWTATADAWADLPRIAADGYSYAAGDALYAFLRHWGIHDKVHCLIGYSRGAVVMSELTRRLILDGAPPDQVIYLDGEGGGNWPFNGCGGLIYQDCRFDAWGDNEAIRYDNIYSTVNELLVGLCPLYVDLGGNFKIRCYNYNLGQAYSHGPCGDGPPSIITYLASGMIHNGSRYIFPDPPDTIPVGGGLDPDDWDGLEHVADRELFNGNFEWASDAGWQSHGAAGTGHVDNIGEPGSFLELDLNDEFLQHSWFFLREEYVTLSFKYRVSNADVVGCDDSFKATLIRLEDGLTQDWFVTDRCETTTWLPFSRPIPAEFRGKVCTIKLWKDAGGNGNLDSEVRVDDVTFRRILGDANGDCTVNVLDLIDLLLCFGQPAVPGCESVDINSDGAVNVLDLIDLLLNFGTSCP